MFYSKIHHKDVIKIATVIVNGTPLNVEAGSLLSEVLSPTHTVEMPCGGRKSCGKCRVTAKGMLSPVSETEKKYLSASELENGIRLACCTVILGDCEVTAKQGTTKLIAKTKTRETTKQIR